VVLALVEELRKQKIEISEKSLEIGSKMYKKTPNLLDVGFSFQKSIDYL
jgi:hypothetical protein